MTLFYPVTIESFLTLPDLWQTRLISLVMISPLITLTPVISLSLWMSEPRLPTYTYDSLPVEQISDCLPSVISIAVLWTTVKRHFASPSITFTLVYHCNSISRTKPTLTRLWGTTDIFEVEWQFSLDQYVTLPTTEIPLTSESKLWNTNHPLTWHSRMTWRTLVSGRQCCCTWWDLHTPRYTWTLASKSPQPSPKIRLFQKYRATQNGNLICNINLDYLLCFEFDKVWHCCLTCFLSKTRCEMLGQYWRGPCLRHIPVLFII